jgi:hypothetical protein
MNKQFELYENISEFIHNFEENRKNKKAKKDESPTIEDDLT